jgi:hypothetical protein
MAEPPAHRVKLFVVMAGSLRQEYEVEVREDWTVEGLFEQFRSGYGHPGGWYKVRGEERVVSVAHIAEVVLRP